MRVVGFNLITNKCGWIRHRPRRVPSPLPHCGHEDMDSLSLLRAPIPLIPSPVDKLERFPFACSALYICTKPRRHSAFSFLALGAACPVFVSLTLQHALHLFSSVMYSRPLRCCNIHASGTETT